MEYSAAQVAEVLQLAEAGVAPGEICRRCNITDTTYYSWKKRYQGLNEAGIELHRALTRQQRELEREISRLQQDNAALQSVVDALDPQRRQQQLAPLLQRQQISPRHARRLLQLG